MKSLIKDLSWIILAASLALIFLFCFRFVTVKGVSMEDTFEDGQMLFVTMYDKDKLKDNDIAVVWSDNLGEFIVKRVIAKSGDTIYFTDKNIFVNDVKISESYVKDYKSVSYVPTEKMTLPKNSYFVLGDNRNNSTDSRSSIVGIVDKNDIFGVVKCNISKVTHLSSRNMHSFVLGICLYYVISAFVKWRKAKHAEKIVED